MPANTIGEVGQRIATTRQARRMTQADLARTSHVSLSMIRAIERGARHPSDTTLDAIADALTVDAGRLLTGAVPAHRVHAALPGISASIAAYDIPLGRSARPLGALRASVEQLVDWRLDARYTRIADTVAPLLADTARTVHTTVGSHRRKAAALLTSAARSADAVAYKHGARDLSARLIDLMRWAAAQAEDPLLDASVAYVRTETFFAARAHTAGLQALETAIDHSPPPDTAPAAAARGALHMRAAVIAGRAQDQDAADAHMTEARHLSGLAPEGIYLGTAFGPDSVRIHEVSAAVSEGGDQVGRAISIATEWAPPSTVPAERRSGFYIDLARAQLWTGLMGDAFESLQAARAIAPQHTREHPWARETAATLRRVHRSDRGELTKFAEWIGAV